jgi:hypothetical protein
MYVEEIKSTRKGRKYSTYLVRESFREGSKVNHRTIANISNLPRGCIEEIKHYLQGRSEKIEPSKLQVLGSKEYGASKTLLAFARLLQLDDLIHSRKMRWREAILALIVGKLIYPHSLLSLANMSSETMLWQLCDQTFNFKPDPNKHFYPALDRLLTRRSLIQKKLAEKHAVSSNPSFCYLIASSIFKEPNSLDFGFDQKLDIEPIHTGLWTNAEGCPWAVETFFSNPEGFNFEETTKKILKSLHKKPIIIGDGQSWGKKDIASVHKQGFETIVSLTHLQKLELVGKISLDLSEEEPNDVLDSEDSSLRYILYFNVKEKKEEFAHLKQKSKEERFYDFTILRTNITKEIMSIGEIISAYQKLCHIQHVFSFVTIPYDFTDHPKDNLRACIHLHTFLAMLSYYLQWHMDKKLHAFPYFDEDGKQKYWTCREAIERLKAIRSQVIRLEHTLFKDVITNLDEDQKKIVGSLLGHTNIK